MTSGRAQAGLRPQFRSIKFVSVLSVLSVLGRNHIQEKPRNRNECNVTGRSAQDAQTKHRKRGVNPSCRVGSDLRPYRRTLGRYGHVHVDLPFSWNGGAESLLRHRTNQL